MNVDYMLVWENKGRNSPLYRGVLREDFPEKRLMSSIMKSRSLPYAGVWKGKISRAEVACAETQKYKISPRSESC